VGLVFDVILVVLWLFLIALFARVVISLLQIFARDFRPTGFVLVLFEAVFSVTDPPLLALRRVIPPIRIGGASFDLAILVLFIGVNVLMTIVNVVAASV
jgi:YggT family protein